MRASSLSRSDSARSFSQNSVSGESEFLDTYDGVGSPPSGVGQSSSLILPVGGEEAAPSVVAVGRVEGGGGGGGESSRPGMGTQEGVDWHGAEGDGSEDGSVGFEDALNEVREHAVWMGARSWRQLSLVMACVFCLEGWGWGGAQYRLFPHLWTSFS